MTNQTFADYVFEVQITVRRQKTPYDSDTLASVVVKEQITMQTSTVDVAVDRVTREALGKAKSSIGIKHGFERDMLALEAGDDSLTTH